MRFSYELSNLLGTVYKQGNVVFTNDGNTLISPVGNRITAFNLVEYVLVSYWSYFQTHICHVPDREQKEHRTDSIIPR